MNAICPLASAPTPTSKHALLISQPRIHANLFIQGSATSHTKDIPFMQLNAAAAAAAATLPETSYLEVMKQIKESDLCQIPVKTSSLNLSD